MAISSKFILQQGSVIASMGRVAIAAARNSNKDRSAPETPGPEIKQTVPPRSRDLIKTYVRHVGGDPSSYKTTVPPHLFPQWGFGLASQALLDAPYPLSRVMNGGCRLEVNAPLPNDQPLEVSARLQSIDDDGRRVVLEQRIVTSTKDVPEAIVATMYAIVPLSRGDKDKAKKKDKPRVPADARELAYWKLSANAGLDFAKLTGDFNPIHWIKPAARASGFKNTILHGFSTMARAMEGLNKTVVAPGETIRLLDVRFTRPLVLPARVGLYRLGNEVFVGDAPGGPAYLTGQFVTGQFEVGPLTPNDRKED